MHNRYPQLGSYHKGLGRFVYNDDQGQMGDFFSDLAKSASTAIKSLDPSKALQQQISDAKGSAIDSFLNTGTGQAVVADAKQSWLDQQAANVKTQVKVIYAKVQPYQNYILLGGAALVIAFIATRPRRKAAAPAPVVAATNPRRRKHKRSRRK